MAKTENPGALAGAARVDVTMLAGKVTSTTLSPPELQVRMLLIRYSLSLPVALLWPK